MDKIGSLKELASDDFVKVTQIDGPVKDRLNFSGQVVKIIEDMIEIRIYHGIIGLTFPKCNDNTFEINKLQQKPNGWDEFLKNPSKFNEVEVVEIKKTKKEQVFDLVKDNKKKSLSTLLNMAKKQIGGNEVNLQTYIQLALQKIK